MAEVKTILNYSNVSSEEMEQCENNNWNIALVEEHKDFVAHHFYQQFVWEKMTGDNFDWFNYFFFWKVILVPTYLALFLCYPFVIFIDFFRNADILFGPPKAQQSKNLQTGLSRSTKIAISIAQPEVQQMESGEQENIFFQFFREKIHRPFFRIFIHIAIEIVFMISLILCLVDPKDKRGPLHFHWYDGLTYSLILFFFIDDIMEVVRLKWKFFSSFWNSYTLLNNFLFCCGITLQFGFCFKKSDERNTWSGYDYVNIGVALFAIASTMAMVRSIRWMLLWRGFGPIIICIIRVIKDIFIVCLLYFIFFVAFALAIYALLKPYRGDVVHYPAQAMTSASKTFTTLFWRFFDPGTEGEIEIKRNFTATEILSILKSYQNNEKLPDTETIKNSLRIMNFTSLTNQENVIKLLHEGTTSLQGAHLVGTAFMAVYQVR